MDSTNIKPSGQASGKKNKMVLSNLSRNKKNALKAGGLAAVGIGIGAAIFSLYSSDDPKTDPTTGTSTAPITDQNPNPNPVADPVIAQPTPAVVIYTDAPMAESVTDEMSFAQGFAAAREEVGAGGFFEWHGNFYNTYYKEEWVKLSPQEQDQYLASIEVQTEIPVVPEEIIPVEENVPAEEIIPAEEVKPAEVEGIVSTDQNTPDIQVVERINTGIVVNTENSFEVDYNNDGIIDGIAVDLNNDNFIDLIVVDSNGNGLPDTYIINSDEVIGLDTTIIDSDEDFVLNGNEESISLDEPMVFEMPADDNIPYNPDAGVMTSIEMEDQLPDMNNITDVSDFDGILNT